MKTERIPFTENLLLAKTGNSLRPTSKNLSLRSLPLFNVSLSCTFLEYK